MGESVDRAVLDRFALVIQTFSNGERSAAEFVDEFLDAWKRDRDSSVRTGDQIDNLMVAVDCYDDAPTDPWHIDDAQLREEARAALALLKLA